jgi:uncharacterized protein YjbI with pentapeptide repeats
MWQFARTKDLVSRAKRARWTLLTIGFVVLLLACVFASVLFFPALLVDRTLGPGQRLPPAERVKAENDVRTTLLQGVAGLLLLVGAIATWRQLRVSREGQITERFTKAIDQLDHAKALEVRLGAIYALERIARDSERDHWPIMEVLTAYVREHAAWKEPEEEQFKPAPDIQAILSVLRRRARTLGREEYQTLDLTETDLRVAALARAHLEGAALSRAHLDDAVLFATHLERAFLVEAHLARALLVAAYLEGAHLVEARLEYAVLRGARLKGANLTGAYLEGANLTGAYLEGADLSRAHLEGVNLSEATGLTKWQIEEAITDESTKLPNDLAPHVRRSDVITIDQDDTCRFTSRSERAREWLQQHARGNPEDNGWLVVERDEAKRLKDELMRAGLRVQKVSELRPPRVVTSRDTFGR